MLSLLADAEAGGSALSFVVLMPGWKEVPGWQVLQQSSFLRHSLLVAAADHGYCDGASHQRRDLYRGSPFDTSVMCLQTSAAAAKWPVRAPVLEELRLALASCCPTAAAAERQKKKRGRDDLALRGAAVVVGGGSS
jgi:phosphorylated CTD-interacting factor 1